MEHEIEFTNFTDVYLNNIMECNRPLRSAHLLLLQLLYVCWNTQSMYACVCIYNNIDTPIHLHLETDLEVSLYEVEVVSEDRSTTVPNICTGLEHVHSTHCGCLTHLFANGRQRLHHCTQEGPLSDMKTKLQN